MCATHENNSVSGFFYLGLLGGMLLEGEIPQFILLLQWQQSHCFGGIGGGGKGRSYSTCLSQVLFSVNLTHVSYTVQNINFLGLIKHEPVFSWTQFTLTCVGIRQPPLLFFVLIYGLHG